MKNKKNLTKSILENIDTNITKNKNTYKLQHLKNNKSIHIKNKSITNNKVVKKEEYKCEIISNKSDVDSSAFIMVPINHPKINEIMNLLNNNQSTTNTKNIVSNNLTSNNEIFNLNINQNEQPENIIRLIITLNDILNNYNQDELIIPKYSIITPLARDYIKQKKMKVIYV